MGLCLAGFQGLADRFVPEPLPLATGVTKSEHLLKHATTAHAAAQLTASQGVAAQGASGAAQGAEQGGGASTGNEGSGDSIRLSTPPTPSTGVEVTCVKGSGAGASLPQLASPLSSSKPSSRQGGSRTGSRQGGPRQRGSSGGSGGDIGGGRPISPPVLRDHRGREASVGTRLTSQEIVHQLGALRSAMVMRPAARLIGASLRRPAGSTGHVPWQVPSHASGRMLPPSKGKVTCLDLSHVDLCGRESGPGPFVEQFVSALGRFQADLYVETLPRLHALFIETPIPLQGPQCVCFCVPVRRTSFVPARAVLCDIYDITLLGMRR